MTTTSKKGSPEEELERQYRDYKAQFEAWKEKNKGSVGTEAYTKYVQQFEKWEKDVQQRREVIRARAEHERQAAAAEQQKRKEAAEAREKQAAEAAAYEQQQKAYLAHHQNALQQQQKERERAAAAAAAAAQAQHVHQHPHASSSTPDASHMIRHAENKAVPSPNAYHSGHPHGTPVPINGSVASTPAPAPQLWGNTRVVYDHNDPMFRKWGPRAAPPNSLQQYNVSRPDVPMTPCWLLIEQMKEKKLMFEPSPNLPPPPLLPKFSASFPPPNIAPVHHQPPPPQVLIEPPEKRSRVM
ncbi:hypothetical protein QR680_006566 [Steinernema hermaphroditum]|uniref:Uncharacterized protein n=1 Tax=Steinernema hermaphroditum TaxID=289476 RepID=A0AA39HVU8_9BILA|nr:hypothetical protein QR680_006566 [Steinernema hermaphroditum]